MISHSLKTIFFHIGKAAGSSVEKLLDENRYDSNIPNYEVFFGYEPSENIYLQHASASFIYENLENEIFNSYYKFAVVRNPYERLVSVYHYLIDQHTKRFGSFEAYINELPKMLSNNSLKNGSHHLAQISYTHINNELICDHIAHFESLPESIQPVIDKLNLAKGLGKYNVGRYYNWQTKPVSDYYTDEMIDIVTTLFADDFSNFAYSKDPRRRYPDSI